MTALLVGIACSVAYLCVGCLLARWDMPRAWERVREHWVETVVREKVISQVAMTALLWPIVVPVRLLSPLCQDIATTFGRVVDKADPRHREREIQRREHELTSRERRIAELERELGIGAPEGATP